MLCEASSKFSENTRILERFFVIQPVYIRVYFNFIIHPGTIQSSCSKFQPFLLILSSSLTGLSFPPHLEVYPFLLTYYRFILSSSFTYRFILLTYLQVYPFLLTYRYILSSSLTGLFFPPHLQVYPFLLTYRFILSSSLQVYSFLLTFRFADGLPPDLQ